MSAELPSNEATATSFQEDAEQAEELRKALGIIRTPP
jgi:hypothetical protein